MSEPGNPMGVVAIGGDMEVGRVGYGAMQLTGDGVWGEYPRREHGIDRNHSGTPVARRPK
jgi:hypothetical protein